MVYDLLVYGLLSLHWFIFVYSGVTFNSIPPQSSEMNPV